MERTPAAAYAAVNPPSFLNSFRRTVRPLAAKDLKLSAQFDLACKACETDVFEILCYPKVAPDPSPYYLVEPGQVFYRPPFRLRCVACQAVAPLLDIRTQGYDGVLNIVASYESGEDNGVEAAVSGEFRVSVDVYYNIDLEELQELASEVTVEPSDLFDWVSIDGEPVGEGEPFSAGFECA